MKSGVVALTLAVVAQPADRTAATLSRLYARYTNASTRADVAGLIQVDQALRRLLPKYNTGTVAEIGAVYLKAE